MYSKYFYSAEANELFTERQIITEMLRFEAGLAKAQSKLGIVPEKAAEIIENCCRVEFIDANLLQSEIILGGNAAIPLVKQLTRIVKNNDVDASKYVHLGATSQDVVDTATALQIQKYGIWLEEKLDQLISILTKLTQNHRNTLMIGRTLLQQAKPITFGLKTAGWLEAIERSKERIEASKKSVLQIQLAGAVGSGNNNITTEVQQNLAQLLGLNPSHSWQSNRDSLVEWASVLAILNQSMGKIAKDVSLMMQTEIAEVFEKAADGKGGSSTMPHKRNPVTCAAILANANRVPNLLATLLSAMLQEHERSAGLWHSEWETLADLMKLTAGSLERSIDLLEGLEVDSEKMLENIAITKGLIYAENIVLALASTIGKYEAHILVEKACKLAVTQKKNLKEILIEMKVKVADIEELFKPENSIGNSLEIIDLILKKNS